ncbi:unnamed protein product [Trichobilharzia szidati]|nr:unnamed protein product [Trichobilharzia szidati]
MPASVYCLSSLLKWITNQSLGKKMGGSMTKILPGLYIGGFDNAKNEEELIANCISHILVVQNSISDIDRSVSRKYLHLIVNEKLENSLLKQIQLSNDFIHRARLDNGNILVCSDSGMSANVAVVAAYLMTIYSLDYHSAVTVLRGLRFGAHPVEPLQQQLLEFDSERSVKNKKEEDGDDVKTPHHFIPTLEITSASERQRLISIYGDWQCIEEDLNILHDALNSHLDSTEDSEFPFIVNYQTKTDNGMDKEEFHDENSLKYNDQTISGDTDGDNVENNDNSNKNSSKRIASMPSDHPAPSSPHSPTVVGVECDKKNTGAFISENVRTCDSSSLNYENENNLNDAVLADTPTNKTEILDIIQEDLFKSPDEMNETDVFLVDPGQIAFMDNQSNKDWDVASQTSSLVGSENSIEIGLEVNDDGDDAEDNIPGAIEIPINSSGNAGGGGGGSHRGSYHLRTARTYNHRHQHYYGKSNASRSMHITAHSLYPTGHKYHNSTHNNNNNLNMITQQPPIFSNTSMWSNSVDRNTAGSRRFSLHDNNNNNDLSSTIPTCELFSRLNVS